MRENRMEIANSNDVNEIEMDWEYLEDNAVPQLDEKIDWSKPLKDLSDTVLVIVKKIILSQKS
jgi:hypothetical protein